MKFTFKNLLFVLFGRSEKKGNFFTNEPTINVVEPGIYISEEQWMKEFKVGSMYGKKPFKERILVNPNWTE